ncbi:198_t:CDS:1, partial [Entrophospora sp. SA101]
KKVFWDFGIPIQSTLLELPEINSTMKIEYEASSLSLSCALST